MLSDKILNANSIAVVGASKAITKRGYQAIRILLEEKYEGTIYGVNPKLDSVLGVKCYPKVSAITDPVDLALITTPAKTLPKVLEDCGQKGVAGAVIIAGGFGELGAEGKKLEAEMANVARKYNIRLIGPNTSGMINMHKNLNLVGLRDAPKGGIALISQSGNMALTMITEAQIKSKIGFSYYVGVGNEADINFHEYLEFFENDPNTKAILMYVEGMRNGRKFLQQAYQTTRKKPIVLLKSGRSSTGKRSAGSHTGALAGMSEVARTAYGRAGIIVVEKSDEMLPCAEALANLPPIKNNNIAILADGGGHATIGADELTDLKVNIPEISEKTQKKLLAILPSAASTANPIDVAGGADDNPQVLAECARILLHDPNIGGVLVVGLFGGYSIRFSESLAYAEEDTAHQFGKLVRETGKPIIMHSLYNFAKPHSLDLLRYYGIPVFDSLELACKAVGALAEYGGYLHGYKSKAKFVFDMGAKAKARGREIMHTARAEGRTALLENEAKELISLHGGLVCHDCLAQSPDQAVAMAAGFDEKVVMKIVSPDILHKSDAGGVRLNLKKPEAIRQAYMEIIANAREFDPEANIKGILVAPMVNEGLEIIIGTKNDDQFGPVIMFGIGGIMVEVLKDVVFRVLPVSSYAARGMIDEIKSVKLLNGFRGQPPVDRKAIKRLLLTISEIIGAYPEIQEMDFNPVIVYEEGLNVVDARIILKQP
ncbi:MAG: acyl-CoA synthetase [Deltaproteobacteria bacterium]|nr:MAG: acyl-CoA synthetase [Deltaproteobacteria bacterium]